MESGLEPSVQRSADSSLPSLLQKATQSLQEILWSQSTAWKGAAELIPLALVTEGQAQGPLAAVKQAFLHALALHTEKAAASPD